MATAITVCHAHLAVVAYATPPRTKADARSAHADYWVTHGSCFTTTTLVQGCESFQGFQALLRQVGQKEAPR